MKKIYILLMHTKTIPSKIVRFFTRYKYSHVAMSLDKSCEVTYSFGRRKLNSILNGGFNILNKEGENSLKNLTGQNVKYMKLMLQKNNTKR